MTPLTEDQARYVDAMEARIATLETLLFAIIVDIRNESATGINEHLNLLAHTNAMRALADIIASRSELARIASEVRSHLER